MESRPTTSRSTDVWHIAGWMALGLVLVVGVPLFVCQPLWQDATHYDVMAQELLRGRVLYRDVTDTNFPGVVVIHAAVRWVGDDRSEILRAFDLLVVAGIAAVLTHLAVIGRSHALPLRLFGAAAMLGYYFSCPPICHCQRDPWMLLPVALAVWLRTRKIAQPTPRTEVDGMFSLAEGACWGAAVWIKPYVVVPAVGCWLAGMTFALRIPRHPKKSVFMDFACLLCGGSIMGAVGLIWLYASGSWPYFWEMMLQWSGEYRSIATWQRRFGTTLTWFIFYAPWSLLHFAAVPLACRTIVRALRPQTPRSGSSDPASRRVVAQLMLSALYLSWLLQALFWQLTHEYVVAATILTAIPVLLSWERLAAPSPAMRIAVAAFAAWAIAAHPLVKPEAIRTWPACFAEGSSPAVKDRLSTGEARHVNGTAHWRDLKLVEEYLRQQQVGDFEVTSWDDTSQYLYTQLHISPGSRFIHLAQWFNFFPTRAEELYQDVRNSQTRYIINDTQQAGYAAEIARVDAYRDEPRLPPGIDSQIRASFPWNQPVVFRAGRYLVHEVRRGEESGSEGL